MKFIKKRDIIILAALLFTFISAYLLTRSQVGERAMVEYDGEILAVFVLTGEQQSYNLPQNPNVELSFGEEGVHFVHSDCPDQVCVDAGVLRRAGEAAACLPNKVMVYIEGDSETDVVL